MWPILYDIKNASGAMPIPAYGTLMALAFTLSFILVFIRSRQIGLHPDRLAGIFLAAAGGGLLGARVLYMAAVNPASFFQPAQWMASGGFAFYGGVLGGALGVFTLAFFQGLSGWKLADLLAPGLMLGLGVGRIGCFFAGCCHGAVAPHDPSVHPLLSPGTLGGQIWSGDAFPYISLEFYGGVGRILNQPLYPTQLWSAAAGIGLCIALSLLWERRRFDGQIIGTMLIIEPIFRFLIEAFRADHRGVALQFTVPDWVASTFPGMMQAGKNLDEHVMGLSTSQSLGLVMITVGIGIWATRWGTGVVEEFPIEGDY